MKYEFCCNFLNKYNSENCQIYVRRYINLNLPEKIDSFSISSRISRVIHKEKVISPHVVKQKGKRARKLNFSFEIKIFSVKTACSTFVFSPGSRLHAHGYPKNT